MLSMLQRSSHPPHFLHNRAAVTRHPFYATEQRSPSVILILQSSSHIIHTFYPTEQQSPFMIVILQSSSHPLYFLCYRAAATFYYTYQRIEVFLYSMHFTEKTNPPYYNTADGAGSSYMLYILRSSRPPVYYTTIEKEPTCTYNAYYKTVTFLYTIHTMED